MSDGAVRAAIAGVGIYVPEAVLTNRELSLKINAAEDYIVSRTGIMERHIADPVEATSDLGVVAAQRAMDDAGVCGDDIDLIIVATVSPDFPVPATACIIQERLGIKDAPAFDLSAACSGFVYALAVGSQFIAAGTYRTILVIASEIFSRVINEYDIDTSVIAGDGAGAVVLRPSAAPGYGILAMYLGADGSGVEQLYIPVGGTRTEATPENVAAKMHKAKMNGQDVFRFAMRTLPDSTERAVKLAGLAMEDVALIIPHQANLRIIVAAAHRMNLPMDKFMVNVERYGNTSSASIPIALHEALETGRIKDRDIIVMTGFGAGLAWGSVVMRWG